MVNHEVTVLLAFLGFICGWGLSFSSFSAALKAMLSALLARFFIPVVIIYNMVFYQAGSLNTTALTAPDLYVQVIAPRTRYINGVATDGLGIVGIGSWGPVNSPFLIGSASDQALYLGSPQVRK